MGVTYRMDQHDTNTCWRTNGSDGHALRVYIPSRPQRGTTQMTKNASTIDKELVELLTGSSAHADFDRAVKNVPPEYRGRRPPGAPHSLWDLLEHIRLAQKDILDYCDAREYRPSSWPDDFWPAGSEPPTLEAWQASIDAVHRDRQRLTDLVHEVDLTNCVPQSEDHTYLREVLLVADHTSYHVGQMVLVRRLLEIWPP